MRLDTLSSRETPEGVDLAVRAAGPFVRLQAWLVDALFQAGIIIALSIGFGVLGVAGIGLFAVSLFLVHWFYHVAFEVLRGGATPGKRSQGLTVVHADGTPVGWTASLLRNLLRSVDFLPAAHGFGLASMLLSREFQRLGDLAAGTLVVHGAPPTTRADLPSGAAVPPPVPLDAEEQRALLDFASRVPSWSRPRSLEIARRLVPLLAGSGDRVERLLAHARWIQGRR